MGIQVMVIKTFQNPVLKSAKIRRCQKKSLARFLQKIKTTFLEHAYFALLKLKMWFFVQECAAELPFLSSVKIIFQKFRFFSQILSPIRLGAILCAHAILCAPTVEVKISKTLSISLLLSPVASIQGLFHHLKKKKKSVPYSAFICLISN